MSALRENRSIRRAVSEANSNRNGPPSGVKPDRAFPIFIHPELGRRAEVYETLGFLNHSRALPVNTKTIATTKTASTAIDLGLIIVCLYAPRAA